MRDEAASVSFLPFEWNCRLHISAASYLSILYYLLVMVVSKIIADLYYTKELILSFFMRCE
jgi:hypothetical protein